VSKQKPQSQESLTKQLRKLIDLANKNGLYDAADYISRMIEMREGKRR
jgi:hypothetical protein